MNSFIQDDELLEKYNGVWNKVSNSIKEDCESVFNKKFLKTKIRSYGDEATYFHIRKNTEPGSDHTCWSLAIIDCVLIENESCYPQLFLKKFKQL